MNISSKIIKISVLGIAFAACAPMVFAQSSDFVPSLGPANNSEAGATLVPTNPGSNDAEGGVTLVPTTGGQNGTEIPVTAPVVDVPVVTTSSGGGSYTGGGSFAPSAPIIPAGTSCPLITSFMSLGATNNGAEVAKLQAFLNSSENLNVDVNGIFDQKTSDAISSFQLKYRADILGPWGAAVPSGRVYITTLKKINELACQSPLTLSADELAIINTFKNRSTTGTSTSIIGENGGTTNASSSASTSQEFGSNGTGNSNTAAAANTSVFGRFWNFVKNLF